MLARRTSGQLTLSDWENIEEELWKVAEANFMLDLNGNDKQTILKYGEDVSDAELLLYHRELDPADEPSPDKICPNLFGYGLAGEGQIWRLQRRWHRRNCGGDHPSFATTHHLLELCLVSCKTGRVERCPHCVVDGHALLHLPACPARPRNCKDLRGIFSYHLQQMVHAMHHVGS